MNKTQGSHDSRCFPKLKDIWPTSNKVKKEEHNGQKGKKNKKK